MSVVSDRLHKWLQRNPKPDKVEVRDADGESHVLTVGSRWRDLAEDIANLDPVLVLAYAGGQLLRTEKFGEGPEVSPEVLARGGRPIRDNAEVPIPEVLQGDANVALLGFFANLLHRSYQHSTEVAFDRILDVVELQSQRNAQLEARLGRVENDFRDEVMDRVEEAWDRVEQAKEEGGSAEKGDLLSELAAGFLNGAKQGKAEAS